MTNPTDDERREMLELMKKAHAWIDALQIAGIEENVVVTAIHTVLVERALRAGGAPKTAAWLQGQAEMVQQLGPQMLEAIIKEGR